MQSEEPVYDLDAWIHNPFSSRHHIPYDQLISILQSHDVQRHLRETERLGDCSSHTWVFTFQSTKWVASTEKYTRRAIHSVFGAGAVDMKISDSDADGEDDDGFVAVAAPTANKLVTIQPNTNITIAPLRLLGQNNHPDGRGLTSRLAKVNLIFSDSDVADMASGLFPFCVNPNQPYELQTSGSVDLYEYCTFLMYCIHAGEVLWSRKHQFCIQLNDKNLSMMPSYTGHMIEASYRCHLMIGTGMASIATTTRIQFNTLDVDQLPIVIATPEQQQLAHDRALQLIDMVPSDEGHMLSYSGPVDVVGMWGSRIARYYNNTRVVIDPVGLQLSDMDELNNLIRNGVDGHLVMNENGRINVSVTDIHANGDMLKYVNPVVIGFNLAKAEWFIGSAAFCSRVKFRDNAFDQLVLPPTHKKIIKAVTTCGTERRNIDFVDGKGGGAIILLNGVPGTGKTLTAEATAESLHRVLYKIGVSELMCDGVSGLEANLYQALSLAARWNAVILIDEADVFLERRSNNNIERNVMVSTFLRLLEYYDGVLFLTTNRGDDIDSAFLSRISVALNYKLQKKQGMELIWSGLLTNAQIQYSSNDIQRLVAYNVNGRVIKNAISSAIALAEHDGVEVTIEHIASILELQNTFITELNKQSN